MGLAITLVLAMIGAGWIAAATRSRKAIRPDVARARPSSDALTLALLRPRAGPRGIAFASALRGGRRAMSFSRFVVSALAAFTGLTGCVLRTGPAHATTAVTAAPAQIETYPSTVYDRRTVYLYEDRWYYRDRGSWAYYLEEPAPLYRSRHRVPAAPPATRGPYAPPHVAPAPRSARRQ